MNNQLSKVMDQAIAENKQELLNEKEIAILDIEKAKKFLWGCGNKEDHREFLTEKGRSELKERLNKMSLEELEALNSRLEAQINSLMAAMYAAKQAV